MEEVKRCDGLFPFTILGLDVDGRRSKSWRRTARPNSKLPLCATETTFFRFSLVRPPIDPRRRLCLLLREHQSSTPPSARSHSHKRQNGWRQWSKGSPEARAQHEGRLGWRQITTQGQCHGHEQKVLGVHAAIPSNHEQEGKDQISRCQLERGAEMADKDLRGLMSTLRPNITRLAKIALVMLTMRMCAELTE